MSDAREFLRRGVGDYEPGPEGYERVLRRLRRRQRNQRVGALFVATAIVAMGAAALLAAFHSGTVPADRTAPAPDGWIVFSAGEVSSMTRSTPRDLYVVREGSAPRLVVGKPGERIDQSCPAIAPDGRRLAYLSQDGGHAAIVIAPLSASGDVGKPEATVDITPSTLNPCARWSPDGQQLAMIDGGNVAIVDADGRVSTLEDVGDISDIAWSPDGARIAVRHASTVSVIDVASGRSDTILRGVDGADVGQLAWSGDRLAIGASDRTPGVEPSKAPASIRIVDLGTGAERDVQVGPHGWVDNVTWLPDGRIVFTDATGPIYVVDPGGDIAPQPLVDGPAWQPVLSPDGLSIVYETLGGTPQGYALFAIPVEGGAPVQLTPWSRDLEYADFDW